jgi:hypothetical protein
MDYSALRVYPDVYERAVFALESLRAEPQNAGVVAQTLEGCLIKRKELFPLECNDAKSFDASLAELSCDAVPDASHSCPFRTEHGQQRGARA